MVSRKSAAIVLLSLVVLVLILVTAKSLSWRSSQMLYFPSTHNFICSPQKTENNQTLQSKEEEEGINKNKDSSSLLDTEGEKSSQISTGTGESQFTPSSSSQSPLTHSPHSLDDTYFWRIFRQRVDDLKAEKFTILIMTYKRASILKNTIPHYCSAGPSLHKVLIVWNDLSTQVPEDLKRIRCGQSKLEFIASKENKLTNRFIPYKEIETECVAIIDDDRKVLISDLLFGFETWQQFRHRIVGFEERTFDTLPDGTFFYGTKKGLQSEKYGYSAMISATFIMSKTYLEMFHMSHFLPNAIYKYIDKNMNCEDLAMCIMVTDFLRRMSFPQTCCVSVNAKQFPMNLEATNHGSSYRGLSMRRGHYNGRSDCLNYFAKSYNGTMPLIYTHSKVAYNDYNYYKS